MRSFCRGGHLIQLKLSSGSHQLQGADKTHVILADVPLYECTNGVLIIFEITELFGRNQIP
jgi:hypothetical protein